jgi:hypothetical protein
VVSNELPELTKQAVYRVGQVLYLPHYTKPNLFVGPGFPKHDPRMFFKGELLARGAIKDQAMLWPRAYRD